MLVMCKKQRVLSAPYRSRQQATPWSSLPSSTSLHRSLTSVHPHSSHSLVPSNFDGMSYSNQPGCGETTINRNTYKLLVLFSEKMIFRGHPSAKKRSSHGYHPAPDSKTCPQSNARQAPKNRQARRRPAKPPGSNTRVCLDFVSKTFNFQKLLKSVAY